MAKKHATDDHDAVSSSLCGLPTRAVVHDAWIVEVDNANPDCKRCLRSIAKRTRQRVLP